MELTLKTNRKGLIKFILPFFSIVSFFFIVMLLCYIIDYKEMEDNMVGCIIIACVEILLIVVIFLLKFAGSKTYFFTHEKIIIYRKQKQINQIDIDNIIEMKYKKFHFRYIVTTFTSELMDGGCWKLYLRLTNGSKIALDIFDIKDVEKLKDLYGELVQIS